MDTPEQKLGPSLEERKEAKAQKQRKEYVGRRALLNTILAKSPSTQKWILDQMLKTQKTKEKSVRDIGLLAKSLGVKLKTLELE